MNVDENYGQKWPPEGISVHTNKQFLVHFCIFYLWRGIACPLDELSVRHYTICENHTTVHGLLIHSLEGGQTHSKGSHFWYESWWNLQLGCKFHGVVQRKLTLQGGWPWIRIITWWKWLWLGLTKVDLEFKKTLHSVLVIPIKVVQSRPLVRSVFCPKKFDHTSGLSFHPGCNLL